MQKVIFLMGPTASGKTALAMELYKRLPIDLISVDSAMIYRGMDIGTAKPSKAELAEFPHALIDIKDPKESYSAGEFCLDAKRLIEQSLQKGRIPLLVGGTMLYFNALKNGLSELPQRDPSIRASLDQEGLEKGWASLHARLKSIDPIAANKIHVNDPQRIQRALEVYMLTGEPMSNHWAKREALPYPITSIAVSPEREQLHARISVRFHRMMEQGFLVEVEKLYRRGDLDANLASIRSVGYRQAWDYFLNKITLAELPEKAIAATRGLAKRQLTWLKPWPDLNWLASDDRNLLDKALAILT